jgi:hypothetical protein
MPTKFKDFFLKWNSIDKVDNAITTSVVTNVLKMFGDNTNFEMAISIVRDLSIIFPSKQVLWIFTRFLTAFATSKQFSILKTQVARSLNLMLIRTPKEQINYTIKISLPTLIKNFLMEESAKIFENVPEETNEFLSKSYSEYISRNRP